jgi:hypothetical protein
MYYNTTNLNGSDLKKSTGRAESQTEKILRFFLANPWAYFTPLDIHRATGILLTSVRRSISDLTKSDDLVKTEKQCMEMYGAINYKWTLNKLKHKQVKQLRIF